MTIHNDTSAFDTLFSEFTPDEADNILTALNTLTSLSPVLFPHGGTRATPDYQKGVDGPSGVRFTVYSGDREMRMVRLPREDLGTVSDAVETVLIMASIVGTQAA